MLKYFAESYVRHGKNSDRKHCLLGEASSPAKKSGPAQQWVSNKGDAFAKARAKNLFDQKMGVANSRKPKNNEICTKQKPIRH
jgi:hypothetical protein